MGVGEISALIIVGVLLVLLGGRLIIALLDWALDHST